MFEYKHIEKTIFIIFLLWVSACHFVHSQDSLAAKKSLRRTKLLPLAYYTPETRIGVGALVYSVFRINKSDTISRYSNIQSYISYTQNNQLSVENEWQIFSKNEKYIFTGGLDCTRFPEYFYGIGNFTCESSRKLYAFDMFSLRSKNVRHLGEFIFGGIQYQMQYLTHVEKSDSLMMNPLEVPGGNGYFISGTGALLLYDTRNNVLNSTSGNYAELAVSTNKKLTMSHFNFTNMTIDLRKFISFFDRYTLALQVYGNFNNGTVPFRAMPAIGGARYLRGYYRGRFRDNNLMVIQGETRMHLFQRVGMVAFAGIGQVADKARNFDAQAFRYNYGMGLRYKLNKKENINLRLDIGFTKEGYGLYIVFAEAF